MMVDSQADSRLGVFRGARVMITGGVGQIGSALAQRLLGLGADLLLVDSMIPEYGGNFANIAGVEGRVRVNISDIRDSHAMRHMLRGQDFLFNLAAQTSHADSMTRPDDDLAINCTAQLHILEACREVAPDIVIVHASTRQIYGHPRYVPVDEAHPLHPVDVNGVNKIAGEHYHILYHDAYGIKTRALRLTNVYGPGMRIKDARQNFLGIWLRLAIEGRPFEVWGGEQRRDMLYVDDAVDAFLAAAVSSATAGLALNVGGDVPCPLIDIAAGLVKANGGGTYTIREFPEERKKIDVGDFVTDDRKFRELADWAPKTSLAEGLALSIAYYRPRMSLYV